MLAVQLFTALSAAVAVSAGPLKFATRACDTSSITMDDLPAGQTQLVAPTTAPIYVLLGVGIQNYTCSSAGAYSSIGAVASLFDISCVDGADYADIQTTAYDDWTAASATVANSIGASVGAPDLLGFHYFVTAASGTGISPKWDLTTSTNDASSFVIGAKVGDIAAPSDPSVNVDWLALNGASGSLASKIFRIDTVGGQPPTSCTVGSDPISVKYTAKYLLY
ncbi:hypothetical protein C8F01DRAFT_1023734 [Mycena amicta]|nr:hypothetical protein C8F01DRAFT_1023734 [Mycena amicta]